MFTQVQQFKSLFGVSPFVCSKAWNSIQLEIADTARPVHLFRSLLFLKTYATANVLRMLAGADTKTLRK